MGYGTVRSLTPRRMQTTTAKTSFVNAVSAVVKEGGTLSIPSLSRPPVVFQCQESRTDVRLPFIIYRSHRVYISTNDIQRHETRSL